MSDADTDDADTWAEPEDVLQGTGDDPENSYSVVGFDPGGRTGWAVISVHPEAMTDPDCRVMDNIEMWSAGEFFGPRLSQLDQMIDLCNAWPSARLVCEDFILRRLSPERELLEPVRLAAQLEAGVRPRYVILQQPALALTTITDERLRAMGFWLPGQEHARDATKHVLTWLKRTKERNDRAYGGDGGAA